MKYKQWIAVAVFFLTVLALLIIFSPGLSFIPDSLKKPAKLGLDLQGGMHLVLEAQDTPKIKVNDEVMSSLAFVIDKRVNTYGVSEPIVQRKGQRQIIVELPGLKDPDRAIRLINAKAQLEFYEPNEMAKPGEFPWKATDLTGADLKKAAAGFDQYGNSIVNIEFNDDGRKKFGEISTRLVKKPFAILLDGKIISDPIIQEPILGGAAQISGNFTSQEAQDLAIQLNAGALPVPVEIVENRTVGPSLGQDSIDKSFKAGILGLGLVMLFMLAYYRLPGIWAALALSIYTALAFAVFLGIPVVLTLPGIAGFILSIGMAVDANILIFERLKEELRSGKTLLAAIETGFNRAFSAIFDSNMTTWIACAILFYFGTGLVKGFALTLAIGVAVSMFTAITVTRTLLYLTSGSGRVINTRWFGVKPSEIQPMEEAVLTHSARRRKAKK